MHLNTVWIIRGSTIIWVSNMEIFNIKTFFSNTSKWFFPLENIYKNRYITTQFSIFDGNAFIGNPRILWGYLWARFQILMAILLHGQNWILSACQPGCIYGHLQCHVTTFYDIFCWKLEFTSCFWQNCAQWTFGLLNQQSV